MYEKIVHQDWWANYSRHKLLIETGKVTKIK